MKCGDPNGEGLPEWKPASEDMAWIDFNDEIIPHNGTDELDGLIGEYMKESGALPD